MIKFIIGIGIVLFSVAVQAQQDRFALVIGNAKYQHGGVLRNPQNDAKDIKRTLDFMGYNVTLRENLKSADLKKEIEAFKNKRKGKISLIYYAGHGVQVNGINYIVPIDFGVNNNRDLVRIDDFLTAVSKNTQYGVAIFDACRNNPFGKTIKSIGFRDLSIRKKISQVHNTSNLVQQSSVPKNTFIAYATKDGKKSSDGAGRNSPFAEALIRFLPENRMDVSEVFRNIRDGVRRKTRNHQDPFTYSSIGRNNLFLTDVPRLKFFDNMRLAVGKHEITVGEYMKCARQKACDLPEWLRPRSEYHILTGKIMTYKNLDHSDQPIVGINWHDANKYLRWLRIKTKKPFRLLSDREWLSVAGHNVNIYQINCNGCNKMWGNVGTAPVESFKEKNGLYDMFGNVWEWVCSKEGNQCGIPILRGGSWKSTPHSILRFDHLKPPSVARDVNIGFRIAATY